MLFKKITLYHFLPALLAAFLAFGFIKLYKTKEPDLNFSAAKVKDIKHILNFKTYELSNQVAFSTALKKRIPVLMGSSELTSNHLPGLAHNFFNQDKNKDRFLAIGHAGFQCFGILTSLAANRALLKDSKITIILSPGWFEEQYAKGTSLTSFFEFAPPNYMYQIQQDEKLDPETRKHISNYISFNFDKISKPDATMRLFGKKQDTKLNELANAPFQVSNSAELRMKAKEDLYLVSQQLILNTLASSTVQAYTFYKRSVNWDSLMERSKQEFKKISNNNDIYVENSYYDAWLKNKRKKRLVEVKEEKNQEYKDLQALLHFLKSADCQPLFVIMPLNTKAHEDLYVLKPTIDKIHLLLQNGGFKSLDMFSPNLENYQEGVLEDIMHPYDLGWYQIDKFILENYQDGK